jgi:hypothetical protein
MRLPGGERRFALAWVEVLCAAALATRPVAAQSPAELSVDCPALSGELLSSLEARARAELAMKRISDGRMRIRCASDRASVEFEPAQGPRRHRDSSLTGEPEDFVEQVLALVHDVTVRAEATTARVDETHFPREPSSSASTPSTATSTSASTTPPEAPPARALPPYRNAVAPAPRAATLTTAAPLRLEPGIGACGELWTAKPLLLLLGPCASFGFRLRPSWRIAASLAITWGTAEPSAISVRNLGGGVEASYGEPFWLGLGARASWLRFRPDEGFAPSSQNAVEPELTLRAGYSWVGRRQSLAAALGLRTYPEYRDVRANGSAAFRVPAVALTASLEYRFDLTGAQPLDSQATSENRGAR